MELLSVGAVDLWMKGEIGSEALGLAWIDAAKGILDQQHGRRRLAIGILDVDGDLGSRRAIEQDVHVAAESQILRALPYVEGEFGFPLACVFAVQADDPIFQRKPAQI